MSSPELIGGQTVNTEKTGRLNVLDSIMQLAVVVAMASAIAVA